MQRDVKQWVEMKMRKVDNSTLCWDCHVTLPCKPEPLTEWKIFRLAGWNKVIGSFLSQWWLWTSKCMLPSTEKAICYYNKSHLKLELVKSGKGKKCESIPAPFIYPLSVLIAVFENIYCLTLFMIYPSSFFLELHYFLQEFPPLNQTVSLLSLTFAIAH